MTNPRRKPPAHLVDLRSAAARLGVHPDTVRRMLARGELTRYTVGVRSVRLDPDEVDAYIVAARA